MIDDDDDDDDDDSDEGNDKNSVQFIFTYVLT
jgi:hypothetical protein